MSPESSPQGEVSRRHVLAGTAAALLWGPGVSRASSETSAPTIHWPVLRLLDGTSLTPLELNTMPVMLVFWETWCPYCKRHNVHIERLYQATQGMPIRDHGCHNRNQRGQAGVLSAGQSIAFSSGPHRARVSGSIRPAAHHSLDMFGSGERAIVTSYSR